MVKSLLIVVLFFSSFSLFPQNLDSIWKEKYGMDQKNWPIWIVNPELMKSGMDLDLISLDQVFCRGQHLAFEESLPFEEVQGQNGSLRIQNGFSYLKVSDEWELSSSYKETENLKPLEHDIRFKGVSLNRYDSIQYNFPSSFLWRDAYANMLHGYVDKVFWKDLTIIMLGLKESNDVLQLFYYKNDLVFLYREINH